MKRFLLTLAAGAALAYFLDPETGASRRARANTWIQSNVNADTWQQVRDVTTTQAQSLATQAQSLASQVGRIRSNVQGGSASSNGATSDYSTPASV